MNYCALAHYHNLRALLSLRNSQRKHKTQNFFSNNQQCKVICIIQKEMCTNVHKN